MDLLIRTNKASNRRSLCLKFPESTLEQFNITKIIIIVSVKRSLTVIFSASLCACNFMIRLLFNIYHTST